MALNYGYYKGKIVSILPLQHKRRKNEIQYHLHARLSGDGLDSVETWDTAINVGTNQRTDLLKFKLVNDFAHAILPSLRNAQLGFTDLTATDKLPALDFLRSDILSGTGEWQNSDVMDGSESLEPVAYLKLLLQKAQSQNATVYVFGRSYTGGDLGIHDVHMNQGSSTDDFINDGVDDHNDHNDVWQDGAVLVDFGLSAWSAYFTAFTQQSVPTDKLGNPSPGGHGITQQDEGSI